MRPIAPFLAAALAAWLALAPLPASAEEGARHDTVVLTDGRTIRGEIVAEDTEFVSIRSEGVLRAYAKDRVQSVTRAPSTEGDAGESAKPRDGETSEGDEPQPDAKRARRDRRAARDRRGADAAEPLGAQARAWLTTVLDLVRSPAGEDPAVRASMAAALRSLGPPALPAIRAAADDADEAAASVLRRVAAAIEEDARAGDAEERTTSDRPARRGRSRELLADLGLDREQAQAARGVLREHVQGARRLMQEARAAGTPREDIRADLVTLRADTLSALRALLRAHQVELLDARADEMFRTLETRRGGKRGKKKDEAATD